MSFLDTVKNAVTSQAAEKVFLLQKNSPKLLFVAGTVGVVGTVVLACRATLQLPKILDDYEHEVADMKAALDEDHGITETEYTKAVRSEKLHTTAKIAKLYALPTFVGIASIAALTGSHVVLDKRNAGLLAGYKALEKGYQQYRERVREELGEEKDREFAHGKDIIHVEEKLADGTVRLTEKIVVGANPDGLSPYAILFCKANSRAFSDIPGENQLILQMKQNWANDKLNAKGHLFLNELRDMLGMKPIPAGQFVGWLSDRHPDKKDGHVSFGIFDANTSTQAEMFTNFETDEVMLDFNVDGEIWSKIG